MDALETCEYNIPDYNYRAGNSDCDIRLLYIGHLDQGRNILFILETMKVIRDKGYRVGLNLVGTGETEYTQKCWKYALSKGIAANINYAERMEQKYLSRLYQTADFFLLPTRYDIFGMVLLEAMYYGLAVLTTENGGSTMMIRDGENGYRLMLNAGKWAKMIIGLYENVANHFTWDVLAPRFMEEYMQVLGTDI